MHLVSAPQVTDNQEGILHGGIPWIKGGRKTVTLSRGSYHLEDDDHDSANLSGVQIIEEWAASQK